MTDVLKDFYSIIYPLKRKLRRGWLDRGLDSDTMSAHMHSAMVLGWILAEEEDVDRQRVVEMLLVHDLVMTGVEDVTPHSGKYATKRGLEEKARKRVEKQLPDNLKKVYNELFREFNAQKTKESLVAKEADKLETLLQAECFEEKTQRNDISGTFLDTYEKFFRTKTGKKYYNELKMRERARRNGK
jgi:putative hydrolase of HD superfamily